MTIFCHAQEQPSPLSIPLLSEKATPVRDFTLFPTSNEAYSTMLSPLEEVSIIVKTKKEGDEWSAPELVSFSGKYRDLEPFLSPDGLKLYFASNRPLNDSSDVPKDFDIWYVERETLQTSWSEAKNLGEPVNSEYNEFYPAVAENGNLYFTSDAPGNKGKDDILLSEWKNGSYSKPVGISDSVNSEGYEFNAYIAPDESFLIFSGYNRTDGYGSGDLYISYHKNGVWTKAENLGETINSKYMDYCPYVDATTNTLYFTSKRSDVSNTDFTSVGEFIDEVSQYANGTSRIYKISLPEKIRHSKL